MAKTKVKTSRTYPASTETEWASVPQSTSAEHRIIHHNHTTKFLTCIFM